MCVCVRECVCVYVVCVCAGVCVRVCGVGLSVNITSLRRLLTTSPAVRIPTVSLNVMEARNVA